MKIRVKMSHLRYLVFTFLLSLAVCADAQRNSQYEAYIEQYKDVAVEQMRKYRIPASITLAQALLESGAGRSSLATRGNNHFGIKCHDWTGRRMYKDDDAKNDCFRVYATARESFEDHSIFLTRSRYARLFTYDPLDYKAWAKGLKACGYATLPTYAERLIRIIETYELYNYDTGKGGRHGHHNVGAEVAVLHNHQPRLVNDVVCYRGMPGDDWDVLAKELGVRKKRLLRYNECEDTYTQLEGMNIFVKKKKSKAAREYKGYWHKVRSGESMYSIAQLYGVRVKSLYKMNFRDADYVPVAGDLLRVR